jgi:hypothetical protein
VLLFLWVRSGGTEADCYGQPEKMAKIEKAMNPQIRIVPDGLRE